VHLRSHRGLKAHGEGVGRIQHSPPIDPPSHAVVQTPVDELAQELRRQPAHGGAQGLELGLDLRIELDQETGGVASRVIPSGR
jgi:hypothetical protein